VSLAEGLFGGLLGQVAVVIQPFEEGLRDLSVFWCRGASKVIESNLEPLVDFLMDLIVLGAQLLGRYLLLQRLGLRRGTVFVRSADVEGAMSAGLMESGIGLDQKQRWGG
jgi:hypothetical protein